MYEPGLYHAGNYHVSEYPERIVSFLWDHTAGIVTGLPAKSYPIFSDYLQFLNQKAVELSKMGGNALQKQVIAADMLTLNQIKKVIERIVDTMDTCLMDTQLLTIS